MDWQGLKNEGIGVGFSELDCRWAMGSDEVEWGLNRKWGFGKWNGFNGKEINRYEYLIKPIGWP